MQVETTDFMTATPYDFEAKFLRNVAGRITNEIADITRVYYDGECIFPVDVHWLIHYSHFKTSVRAALIFIAFSADNSQWNYRV